MTTLVWFLIGLISGAVFMYIGMMVADAVYEHTNYKDAFREDINKVMQEALEQYKSMTQQTLAQYILKENFKDEPLPAEAYDKEMKVRASIRRANYDIERANAEILKSSRKMPSSVPGGTVDEDSSTYGDPDDGSWKDR
jgi:hypothetical protein|tara:strand:- start:11152 stop:11568 length:417 start_codon:yes stop_codon:yes gene_type:complete